MYAAYIFSMNTDRKTQLALTNRSDIVAAAIRVRAARLTAGLSQKKLADIFNRRTSWISNIERARAFPPWGVMVFFQREHRIDLNFLVLGLYSQLPADLQDDLFRNLEMVVSETDLLNISD